MCSSFHWGLVELIWCGVSLFFEIRLNAFANDMKQEMVDFLNTCGRFRAGNEHFQVGQVLAFATALTQKRDGEHAQLFGFFQRPDDVL